VFKAPPEFPTLVSKSSSAWWGEEEWFLVLDQEREESNI